MALEPPKCACGGGATCTCRESVGFQRKAAAPTAARPLGTLARLSWALAEDAGEPLPDDLRRHSETAWGQSLRDVRVHTSPAASRAASDLDARAITVGHDIAFAPGEYQPGSPTGEVLIAHEMAHAVQQRRATQSLSEESPTGRALERQADAAGTEVAISRWGFGRSAGGSPRADAAPAFQRCKKSAPPSPGLPSDFEITGHLINSWETKKIYFERNSSSIPADQATKIPAEIGSIGAASPIALDGYVSEDESASLAVGRTNNVEAALTSAVPPHTGARTKRNQSTLGIGQREYRTMRRVDIQPATAPPTSPSSITRPCGTAFPPALARARTFVGNAVAALAPPIADPATRSRLDQLFAGPSGAPGAGVAVAPTIRANLAKVKTHLDSEVGDPGTFVCNTDLNPICNSAARNVGVGAAAVMNLCPEFLDNPGDVDKNAAILIHEGCHGTTGLTTVDNAYGVTRQIFLLTTAEALLNTDSYTGLVIAINANTGLTAAPTLGVAGDVKSGMGAPGSAEERAAANALGYVEEWLIQAFQDVNEAYGTVNDALSAPAWPTTTPGPFNAETMHILSPLFGLIDPGLTAPYAKPTMADKIKLAAISDRYSKMMYSVYRVPISMSKVPVGVDSWAPGPGSAVTLTPAFFALPNAVAQTRRLIELLVAAMPGISPRLAPSYVSAADLIRRHRRRPP